MSAFLSGVAATLERSLGTPQKKRTREQATQNNDVPCHEADVTDVDLSCHREDIMDSSPPLSPDLSDDDVDKDPTPSLSKDLEIENHRLLDIIDVQESQLQYLREEAQSAETTNDNLTRENENLREQVATLSASLAASMASTPPSPTSPATHNKNDNSDQPDRSRRGSTPAPQQPSSRPLQIPQKRKSSAREKQSSAASLQRALSRARADLARRNTRLRQLEVAYEEKKHNDLQRQARQDWAIDAAQRECEDLRQEVDDLKRDLARKTAGDHEVVGSDDELPKGGGLAQRTLDGWVDVQDELASAKKDICDKGWKIWRLEQQVEEPDMVGIRNGRIMDEQKDTIQALKAKLREGNNRDSIVRLCVGSNGKVEAGYRYDLLGEDIKKTQEEVKEGGRLSI